MFLARILRGQSDLGPIYHQDLVQQDLTQRRRLDRRREKTDSTFWRQNLLGIMAAIKGQQHPPQANGWYLNIEPWKIIRFY